MLPLLEPARRRMVPFGWDETCRSVTSPPGCSQDARVVGVVYAVVDVVLLVVERSRRERMCKSVSKAPRAMR